MLKKLIALMMLLGLTSLLAFEDLNNNNFDSKVKNENVILDFYAVY